MSPLPAFYADIDHGRWPTCPHCNGEMTGVLDTETEEMGWECDKCQLVFDMATGMEVPYDHPVAPA